MRGGEIAFLDLRRTNRDGNDGPKQDLSWEIIPLSLGEDLTLNFGEFPIDASVSSLSSILEDNVPLKYYLSEKACRGILRRSEEKGTPLDPLLKQALWNTIVFSRLIITHKISEYDSAEMVLSKLSLEEWEQAAGMSPLIVTKISEKVCFAQSSYSEFPPNDSSSCLRAKGGSYGGGSETLVAIPYTLKIRGGCEGGGKGALIQKDKSATLSCNNDQSLFVPLTVDGGKVMYLVRKLTPTECASLQGFDKNWCALVPHSDSAEYKMWGNGMALPCMLYIMEGIQEILSRRYLQNLFDTEGDDEMS